MGLGCYGADEKGKRFVFKRAEYARVWREINAGRRKLFGLPAIVVGTGGVGKSALRLHLARNWMHGADGLNVGFDFDSIVFNVGNHFHLSII
jgi:hypothetical protein